MQVMFNNRKEKEELLKAMVKEEAEIPLFAQVTKTFTRPAISINYFVSHVKFLGIIEFNGLVVKLKGYALIHGCLELSG